ncbi:MAG: hypothetical protein HY288_17255 [Planctomycetia bacterium]|nr:hypothetical protein [Planctomycetia bacterium]
MDTGELLSLVFRWLHILAAITAVGGTIFARAVVFPALDDLPSEQRSALHAAMRARWSKIVAAAIGFLLISGLYNVGVTTLYYTLPRWYHPVFGVKFLLACVVFMVASLLIGRTAAAEQIRRNARFWLNLNIILAVLVVCLSGILRTAEKSPREEATPVPASRQSAP